MKMRGNWSIQFESEKAAFQRALGRVTHDTSASTFDDLAQSAAECKALEIAAEAEAWVVKHSEGDAEGDAKVFGKIMNQRLLDSLSVFGSPKLAKALAGIIRQL